MRFFSRRRLLTAALILAALPIGLVLVRDAKKANASHASPHSCAVPPNDPVVLYGRDELCGYFFNQPYLETGGINGIGLLFGIPDNLPGNFNALDGVGNIDQFVSVIRYHLQGCAAGGGTSTQRRNAAAFIILTMMGAPGGTSAAVPCQGGSPYHVNNWDTRVRQYAAAGLVGFNDFRSYQENTLYHTGSSDPMWYHNSTISHPPTPPGTDIQWTNSITFFRPGVPGSRLYSIKKDCANPIGLSGVIPSLGTPGAVACGSALITPATPQPGESFTVRGSFTTSGGTPAGQLEYYQILISLNGPAGSTGRFTDRVGAAFGQTTRSGGSGNGTVPGIFSPAPPPVTIPTPGVYSGSYSVIMNNMSNSPLTCPYTVTIADIPYHRAYGGDIFAGAGFRYGLGCRRDNTARIYGVRRTGGAMTGAGSQLAASALGAISDFPTGGMRTNYSAGDPDHLSFANTNPSQGGLGATVFGGGLFESHAVCAADYYGRGPAGPDLGADATIGSTEMRPVLQAQGNVVIEGRTLGAGVHQTIYVDGNAFITGPILFLGAGNPAYANRTEIPSFRLIVKGNIYVEPAVGQIDGVYIAQADEAVIGDDQGRFYTCGARAFASGPGAPNPYSGFAPNAYHLSGACKTRLTVYGAVIAEVIKLTRTAGSLIQSPQTTPFETYNSGGGPAEVFVFSPEVWLNGEFSSSGEFDAVTALPPVL